MASDDETKGPDPEETPQAEAEGGTDEETDAEVDGPTVAKTRDLSLETPQEVLLSRLESLIFVSPEPITVRRLARILSVNGKRVRELLDVLIEQYANRGIILEEVAGGFQFRSHPDNSAVIRHVFKMRPMRLSRPALETLSIVAYRQPLTRTEVEEIRGVDCGGTLKFLFEKGMLRILGRKEGPGRPIIYGTGPAFLELFGLKTLSDLPSLHEFSDLWDEHRDVVESQWPVDEDEEGSGEGAGEDAEQLEGDAEQPAEDLEPAVDDELPLAEQEPEPDDGQEPGAELANEDEGEIGEEEP